MRRGIVKKLLAAASLASIATSAYSYEYNYEYNNQYNSDQNNSYESSYGNQYQYDLSDQSDRMDYQYDYDAQMRDRLSVEPTRSLDRGLGEYGGGIYD